MFGHPSGDEIPPPYAADGQFGFGSGKVRVRLNDLVNALTRYTEHLGDLRHADEVLRHGEG